MKDQNTLIEELQASPDVLPIIESMQQSIQEEATNAASFTLRAVNSASRTAYNRFSNSTNETCSTGNTIRTSTPSSCSVI